VARGSNDKNHSAGLDYAWRFEGWGESGVPTQQCIRLLRFMFDTAIFWFLTRSIDYGYGSAAFTSWQTLDWGQDELLDVLQGPEEPPSTSTEECCF
jgi:hypothetical protein